MNCISQTDSTRFHLIARKRDNHPAPTAAVVSVTVQFHPESPILWGQLCSQQPVVLVWAAGRREEGETGGTPPVHHHTGQLSAMVPAVGWGVTHLPSGHREREIYKHLSWEWQWDGLQVPVQPGRHGQRQPPRQHQGQDGGVSHIQEFQVSVWDFLSLSTVLIRTISYQLLILLNSSCALCDIICEDLVARLAGYHVIGVIMSSQLSGHININSTICSISDVSKWVNKPASSISMMSTRFLSSPWMASHRIRSWGRLLVRAGP